MQLAKTSLGATKMLRRLLGLGKKPKNKPLAHTIKKRYLFNGFGTQSSCNYHVFSNATQNYLVIEQLKQTTTSITNKIEDIVYDVCKRERLNPSDLKIYEYYPTSTLGSNFAYEIRAVEFNDGTPIWQYATNEAASIIKQKVVPG